MNYEDHLYSINFTYSDNDNTEPEWLYIVGQYPSDETALAMAKQHLIDNVGIDEDDDIVIGDCWVNEVEVFGYEIKLTKVEV